MRALADLPAVPDAKTLDDLAADYAAIYLNNSLGASPYESVWLDDDHLACQRPMFELREIYAEAGFKAVDWRSRFNATLDSINSRHEACSEGEIGVRTGIRNSVFDALCSRGGSRHRDANAGAAIAR